MYTLREESNTGRNFREETDSRNLGNLLSRIAAFVTFREN